MTTPEMNAADKPIRIREVLPSDLPAVRAWMREEPSAPAWSDDDLARLASPASASTSPTRRLRRAWVAENLQQQLVGFAVAATLHIDHAPAECELEFIYVIPQERRSRTAHALMQSVLRWAQECGAQEIWLEVRTSNASAIALYTGNGFAPLGLRPGYYKDPPEDAVLMRCTIAAPV